MIETPADYRSFVFLCQTKIRSVRYARVSGVLFFYVKQKSGLFATLGFPEFCFFISSPFAFFKLRVFASLRAKKVSLAKTRRREAL